MNKYWFRILISHLSFQIAWKKLNLHFDIKIESSIKPFEFHFSFILFYSISAIRQTFLDGNNNKKYILFFPMIQRIPSTTFYSFDSAFMISNCNRFYPIIFISYFLLQNYIHGIEQIEIREKYIIYSLDIIFTIWTALKIFSKFNFGISYTFWVSAEYELWRRKWNLHAEWKGWSYGNGGK